MSFSHLFRLFRFYSSDVRFQPILIETGRVLVRVQRHKEAKYPVIKMEKGGRLAIMVDHGFWASQEIADLPK